MSDKNVEQFAAQAIRAEARAVEDLERELEKAAQCLAACDRHFAAAAEANAALHMSDRVIPNPLASHVALTLENVRRVLGDSDE